MVLSLLTAKLASNSLSQQDATDQEGFDSEEAEYEGPEESPLVNKSNRVQHARVEEEEEASKENSLMLASPKRRVQARRAPLTVASQSMVRWCGCHDHF